MDILSDCNVYAYVYAELYMSSYNHTCSYVAQ